MSVHTLRKATGLVVTIALVALLSGGTSAYAQVDAAAKARATGDYSRWGQQSRPRARSLSASRLYGADRPRSAVIVRSEPAPSSVAQAPTERRSFSHEPAETAPTAKMTHGACGCHGQQKVAQSNDSGSAVATAPQAERRSFSYEPSVQPEPRTHRHNRSAAPKKDP